MSLWYVFFLSFILLNHDHDLNSWLFRITCISQLNIFVDLMLFFGLLDLGRCKTCLLFWCRQSRAIYTVPVQLAKTPTNTQSISFYAKEKHMQIPLTVASDNHFNITHNLCKFIWISYMKCTLLCVVY